MAKSRLNKATRRNIVNAFRDFAMASLRTQDKQRHIDYANTVINGQRQNLPALTNYIRINVLGANQIEAGTVRNLIRRAVGKGGLTDGTSPELIGYFNTWYPSSSNLKTVPKTAGTSAFAAVAQRSSYADVKTAQATQAVQTGFKSPVSPAKVKKPKVVVPPTTTAGIIQAALTNTQFTATELLTKKFTVVEFLDRIGIKVSQ